MSGEVSGEAPLYSELPSTRTAEDLLQRLVTGEILAGRYRILGLIGAGGMGLVYRAHDEKLGLDVAIKVLRPDVARDERRLARFRQELLLARQVSHTNVVRTHDLGEDGDLVFLTMDFVPGRSLRGLLAEEGALPAERVADLARQLASALGTAHAAGVVHRDLKPANILIDPAGRAAITDFGVARSLSGSSLTQPGVVIGTLDYLAPEQALGEEVDGRADLYSLGLVLYEMLAGTLPLSEGSTAEKVARRQAGSTRTLRSAGVVLPRRYGDLERIVKRLLEADPARRYAKAEDLLADLSRLGRETPGLRLPRKGWIAAGATLLLVGSAWGLRGLWRPLFEHAAPRATASPATHAVALLPLVDETGRPDLAWLASGLPDLPPFQPLLRGPGSLRRRHLQSAPGRRLGRRRSPGECGRGRSRLR